MTTTSSRTAVALSLCFLLCTAFIGAYAWAKTEVPPQPGIALTFDDSRLRTIEMAIVEVNNLGNAENATRAGLQGAAATPGYTPAAGLIGSFIGLGIVKGMENSSVHKKANKPIEPLRADYATHWREFKLQESLFREWDARASDVQRRCTAEKKKPCQSQLMLRPELTFLSDARVLRISIDAFKVDNRSRPVLVRKVSYLSHPLATGDAGEINDHWRNENLKAVSDEWETGIGMLVRLLQAELAKSETPKEPEQPIRFLNAAGLFYDRGVILSQADHRIVYRSLDGNITTAYMDRLISTEEYYEWISVRPSEQVAQ